MNRRFVAIMGVLVLAGLVLAFTSAIFGDDRMEKHEDIWLVQSPILMEIYGHSPEVGLEKIPEIVTGNSLSPSPVETTNFSNASKKTTRIIARNQSVILIPRDGKPARGIITLDTPKTEPKTLTTEQKKLAEKIALTDTGVRNSIGTSVYNAEVQPLDSFTVKDSRDGITNGTRASVLFTTVNSTTALDEATFFVHVDLVKENVIRVSPLFLQNRIPAIT